MKVKILISFLCLAAFTAFLAGCGSNMLEFAADDSSGEACEYEVSKNLDDGNWDKVINASSSCASKMQKAAAYFGRAGYDVPEVIKRMIEANDDDNDNKNAEIYLNQLLGTVSSSNLNDLQDSIDLYNEVVTNQETGYEDAEFYMDVIAKPVQSLSNIKGIIDPDGDGTASSCEADAAACALIYAATGSCDSTDISTIVGTPTSHPNMTFSGYSGTYTGLEIETSCSTDTYNKLLTNTAPQVVVVTTNEDCTTDSNSITWKCPYEKSDGSSVDLVETLTDALDSADDVLTELAGEEDSELSKAIDDLREEACMPEGDTDPSCSAEEIADYLDEL